MIGKAIRFLIGQRLLVVAVVMMVSVGGVLAYQNLIMDVFPDPSPALVQIYTEAHGLAPQEVEQLVSIPVEAAMSGLPKVERIRSTSTYGLSLVNVYFEEGTDIYWARQVLAPRLHEIQDDLPPKRRSPSWAPSPPAWAWSTCTIWRGKAKPPWSSGPSRTGSSSTS